MVSFRIFLMASIGSLVTARPEPTPAANLENRAVDCAKVTGALSVLKKLGPPATTFCRSYLKVPGTSTVTTTTTPAAVTRTTSTTTVTVTSAACPAPQKRNVIHDSRGFDMDSPGNIEKRADVLALLGGYAAAKISEGCSCLNLSPTLTKTTTLTAATPTTKVVATSTKCVVGQAACKTSGTQSPCSAASQCCSGLCDRVFGSDYCCDPVGARCTSDGPITCCSSICEFDDDNSGNGRCIPF